MSPQGLYWAGIVIGFGAVVAYFVALGLRPRWVRVVNGAGLFFTGLGLMQVAIFIHETDLGAGWFNANVAVAALILAALIQSYAALRHRRSWDGVDRRAETQG